MLLLPLQRCGLIFCIFSHIRRKILEGRRRCCRLYSGSGCGFAVIPLPANELRLPSLSLSVSVDAAANDFMESKCHYCVAMIIRRSLARSRRGT